ncbi:SDR family oxidoreductase [Eisenibacter elegans]|jgi:dTDP-4-dehydrorhamnose reductase|uniref:SDR family oxidoreductase n=1 Tax=Eisenibacter elegans TaxID=997 RepID=UPI000426FB98|nr:SDR family oxidoreductase [Eisenibacter elegans]
MAHPLRILITGSNGLLGQKLVHRLGQIPEIHLIATARGQNRLAAQNFEFHSLDITNKAAVMEVFAQTRPDAVIHTAAMTQVDDCETDREACWQQNVVATQHLADACDVQGSHLVHLSTDFIFDGSQGPYREDDTPNPISYYGESKLAAEELVRQMRSPWAIARTVLVYGVAEAMSRSNIILWVKKSLENGQTIRVVDDQWRTPTLAEDLAEGCLLIAQQKASGVFNISGKDLLTPYEMAIATADYFGLDKGLIVRTDGSEFQQTARRPPKTGFVIDKAIQQLGYQPRSFTEGIAIVAAQVAQQQA